MDFFSDSKRRINLGGASRGAAGSEAASRAATLEQARLLRQARQHDREREQAASKIQAFWRSRHAHALEAGRQRAAWDADLVRLAQAMAAGSTVVVSHDELARFVARFMFFARCARTRPVVPPARLSAANSALVAADLTRFRHLTKLLLASYRHLQKVQHLGARILTRTNLTEWPKQPLADPTGLPPDARQWVHQSSKIAWLLLEHIGQPRSYGMDQVSSEIMLLWLLLDSTQWAFVKDAAQSTAADKQLIQRTQALLVQKLVAPVGQARLPASTAPSAAASSSSSSSASASQASSRARPVIDLFFALRMRLLDLTSLTQDGVPTPAQAQHKTSVALMFATIIRCITACQTDGSTANPVLLSFLYHILSIPALPQRLRFVGLQALIPSFLLPALWDRSLATLTAHVQQLNSPSFSSSSAAPIVQAFSRSRFSSLSHTWFDDAPLPATQAVEDASSMEYDLSSPPPQYSYFKSSEDSTPRRARSISGLAWTFGNLLELVGQLDETKSDAASRSFSQFLSAIDQLIQAVPASELPALSSEGVDATTLTANLHFPPSFIKQFAVFGERNFLDRLCRRLMAEPVAAPADEVMRSIDTPAASPSPAPFSALDDVPIICVLIDSILFRWSNSSSSILNTLVFSSDIVKRLWASIQRSGLLERIEAAGRGATLNLTPFPAAAASSSSSSSASAPAASYPVQSVEQVFNDRFFNLLPLFCTMYGHLLLILDDDEFFVLQKPFALATDVTPMVGMLKVLLYRLYWTDYSSSGTPARLRERFSKLFVQLRDRQSRRQFMPPEAWLYVAPSSSIPIEAIQQELAQEDEMRMEMGDHPLLPTSRAASLISAIPFVLPFADRVRIFYSHIHADKLRQRSLGINFDHGMGRRIKVRRQAVLADSFEALSGLSGSDIKGRIQVEFTDEHGIPEAGLDGGGLFKELMSSLLRTAFDPSYNLFSATDDHFIHPNPNALDLPIQPEQDGAMLDDLTPEHARQTLQYFHFLGQMIGKALYDGIQIETQFALFFLRFCSGHNNYLDDLRGLDPVIYNSLMKLKAMKDDIGDLGLTFSVDRQTFGVTRSYDLIPNGANISVTNENKVRFIYLMSDYYLNRQMAQQAQAFQQGMSSVINTDWLRMFAAEEFRLLISGSQSINRLDLQRNTQYSSGYTKDHELIRWLWEVIAEFTDEEVAAMLRFATSCSRAPLLGFQHLYPGFCIQRVNVDANEQTLPTAATCMNLLRLPRYGSKQRLKEKLLYAITTASHGFGLT